MQLAEPLRFLKRYVASPKQVGALLPSSRWLAGALTAPFARRTGPARVLEVGAGTGPVTRRLGKLLGPEDHLDICEIDDKFVRILEQTLLGSGPLAHARAEGRVHLLHCPVQDIDAPESYDYIVSGLPLNAFTSSEVEVILDAIQRNLKPGGIFSYFEYVGARLLLRVSPDGRARRRVRAVSSLLDRRIRRHQVARHTVWANVPPAHARHWQFQPPTEHCPTETVQC
jgi:phospholipid N-methyltransferase